MSSLLKRLRFIIDPVLQLIGKVHWPSRSYLSQQVLDEIRPLLADSYFVILTYRKNHLSTFFIGLASFALTGRWARWSHALINLEDSVENLADFRIVPLDRKVGQGTTERVLVEAIGAGSMVSPFEKVFDVHAVALLKPKHMTIDEWRSVMDKAKQQVGKKYDTLFDLADDSELSCVELVRTILMDLPDYHQKFAAFEALIKKRGNLTPSMYYECGDFEVVYEARV